MTPEDDVLDETYVRLLDTGPEFDGWLSNHGPMAADALLRMGRPDDVGRWVEGYRPRLEAAPGTRWTIVEDEWADLLGDASRLGDWCAFFARRVEEEPWTELLARWWPRLLPGAVASATHGLIRTGHAVRALREHDTAVRRAELGQALAYWAARHQPLPPTAPAHGAAGVVGVGVGEALDRLPAAGAEGGIRARLRAVGDLPTWGLAVSALRPVPAVREVPAALDDLVDAALSRYLRWGRASPVMLVHAATAPRAVGLVLPSLPRDLWPTAYDGAWRVTAALVTAYRPYEQALAPPAKHPGVAATGEDVEEVEDVVDRALDLGDEHAIKLTEVALESHRRGHDDALAAALHGVRLIGEGAGRA